MLTNHILSHSGGIVMKTTIIGKVQYPGKATASVFAF